jgi:CheY-like chemotaxis protein
MPRTLLLADDSVTIQRVIELTFADEDVRVVAVSDGEQAIARIDADPPDIVLADVGMPGPSGYEVAEHIKRTPALAHIPVLLLTGAFEPIDEERARAAGCDGVLAKPFEPQLVIERVRELLEHAPPAGGGPRLEPAYAAGDAAADDWSLAAGAPEPEGAAAASGEAPRRSTAATVDEYFDRLDAAFASLAERGMPPPAPPPPAPAASIEPAAFEPPPALEAPAWPRPEAVGSAAAAEPQLPSLSEAFAAILAAERRESSSAEPVAWPPSASSRPLGEEAIDEIVQRVVARLAEQPLRGAVADTVSQIAERLVREEIERIKAHIK